jgi:cell division protein FtsX
MSIFRRISNLLSRSSLDREIEAELKSHVDMRIEDNIALGMSHKDARRDALLKFGNPTATKERVTSADAALAFDSIWADVQYSFRQLYKSPGVAATAVLTMALGIGANLAVFQLLYGVMFAHLAVRQPAQIDSIHALQSPYDGQWFFSYPAYRKLREATLGTAPVVAHSGVGDGILQQPDGSDSRINFQMVSDNFFDALGLSPALGRFFQSGEDSREESEWPVILRYGFFKEHFGGGLAAIGQRAKLNGVPIVVMGVAPDRFNGVVQGSAPDVWLPLAAQATGRLGTWFDSLGPGYRDLDKSYLNQSGIFWLWALARVPAGTGPLLSAHWMSSLAPDVSMMAAASKDAQVRAKVLASRVELVSAENGEGTLSKLYSLPLKILMAMAGVILLVGCLNLTNLQLARLAHREREIAIRIALGASRARVLCQVATESVLLAAIGGPLAFATARVSSALLLHWASGRGRDISIDLHIGTAAYFVGIAALLGTLVFFGLLPAWLHTSRSFSTAVKSRAGGVPSQGKANQRWSNLLLIAYTVIGVLPRDFTFALGRDAEFWVALQPDGDCDKLRDCHNYFAVGRLKPGVSVEMAFADMQSIARQLEIEYPDSNRGRGASVMLLSERIVGDIRAVLLLLLGGAGLLLLIACANVSSLLVVRSESRKREIAMRSALGATRARILYQFATEGILLVSGGALAGLVFAYGVMQILSHLISKPMMASMPYLQGLGLNAHVLSFAAILILLASILFSIVPILHLSFSDIRDGLAEGGYKSGGALWRRVGGRLVVIELAVTMVLLTGAGLLSKSLYRLLHVDVRPSGYAARSAAWNGVPRRPRASRFYSTAARSCRELAGSADRSRHQFVAGKLQLLYGLDTDSGQTI